MLQNEPNGTFLVRESTSLTGEFALTVKNDDSVLHVRIYHDVRPGGFNLGNSSISELFFPHCSQGQLPNTHILG